MLPHFFLHIAPNHKRTLCTHVFLFIYNIVKYFYAQMRHTDFIYIGEAVYKIKVDSVIALDRAAPFAADIASRLFNVIENFVKLFFYVHSARSPFVYL